MRGVIWIQKWIVDKLIGLKRNDQRQRRETSVAPSARCCGEGAAHRNKNADDVAVLNQAGGLGLIEKARKLFWTRAVLRM